MENFKIIFTWCSIDRLYLIYLANKDGRRVAPLGFQEEVPTHAEGQELFNRYLDKAVKFN